MFCPEILPIRSSFRDSHVHKWSSLKRFRDQTKELQIREDKFVRKATILDGVLDVSLHKNTEKSELTVCRIVSTILTTTS